MGESFGCYALGDDAEVFKWISSANVACGFHAGDPHVMRESVELAKANGVAVGAHPGLPDLLGFGRRRMAVKPEELRDMFVYQLGALDAFVRAAGFTLQHVKAHGALSEMGRTDPALARAMCEATREVDPNLLWLTPVGTMVNEAREAGLRVAQDFYTDRAYNRDLSLVSRSRAGSVIKDVETIRRRVDQLLDSGTVTTIDGERVSIAFDSICVHGDTQGAIDIIRLVREVCDKRSIAVKPLSALAVA